MTPTSYWSLCNASALPFWLGIAERGQIPLQAVTQSRLGVVSFASGLVTQRAAWESLRRPQCRSGKWAGALAPELLALCFFVLSFSLPSARARLFAPNTQRAASLSARWGVRPIQITTSAAFSPETWGAAPRCVHVVGSQGAFRPSRCASAGVDERIGPNRSAIGGVTGGLGPSRCASGGKDGGLGPNKCASGGVKGVLSGKRGCSASAATGRSSTRCARVR